MQERKKEKKTNRERNEKRKEETTINERELEEKVRKG